MRLVAEYRVRFRELSPVALLEGSGHHCASRDWRRSGGFHTERAGHTDRLHRSGFHARLHELVLLEEAL